VRGILEVATHAAVVEREGGLDALEVGDAAGGAAVIAALGVRLAVPRDDEGAGVTHLEQHPAARLARDLRDLGAHADHRPGVLAVVCVDEPHAGRPELVDGGILEEGQADVRGDRERGDEAKPG